VVSRRMERRISCRCLGGRLFGHDEESLSGKYLGFYLFYEKLMVYAQVVGDDGTRGGHVEVKG